MAITSPIRRPASPSGAVMRRYCMGSNRCTPVLRSPSITAMGVARKKSRGWVWSTWCSPPTSVTARSTTCQL